MAMTLKEKLDAYKGQPEQPWKERKAVTLSEKGQRYQVTLSPPFSCAVYAIDGGIISDKTSLKCDKLVLAALVDSTWGELFVELKGRDIPHALEQLEATLKNPLFQDRAVTQKKARLIGRSIPRNTGNSQVEKAKKRFMASYHCELRCLSGPAQETITFK